MRRAIQRFQVSLKAFIVRDGRVLFLREADTGCWELPGGRIDVGEETLDHADVLARELREELGPSFRVDLGRETITWTRWQDSDAAFTFILGRLCRYRDGDIVLSAEHSELLWADGAASRALAFPPRSGYAAALDQLWDLVT